MNAIVVQKIYEKTEAAWLKLTRNPEDVTDVDAFAQEPSVSTVTFEATPLLT